MWDVMYFFGMELTRILYSFEFLKVDPPAVPTLIGMTGGILLPLGALGKRYTDIAPVSATPELLLLFSIFSYQGC